MLLLEIGVKTLSASVDFLEIGDFCYKAKNCPKQRTQPSCCSKLASKHSAQMSFCLKLATFFKKVKLVQNTVRNCPVARNWRQNTLRNCRFWHWRLLLTSENLSKTPCATVHFLEICVKALCATLNLAEIGDFCEKAKNCPKHSAQLSLSLKSETFF